MNWTTLLSFSVRGFQVPLLESSSIIVSIEAAKNLEIELFTPQRQEWFLSMLTLLPSSQMMFWSGQEDQLFNIMSDFWWEKLIAQYCNCYGVFLTCWMTVCCHKKFYCYCHCSPNSRNTLKKNVSVSSRFSETRITLTYGIPLKWLLWIPGDLVAKMQHHPKYSLK